MKPKLFFVAAIVVITQAITSCSHSNANNNESAPELSKAALIERGRYLTTIGACNDCHSPKKGQGVEPDPLRLLSGHPADQAIPPVVRTSDWILFSNGLTAFVGPWGVSYAANLTPDDTGIGNWSYDQFKTAIRKGKYKGLEGSRDLLPPMPWEMYRNFTDEDLLAIYTYLQSIPPVKNLVPAPIAPQDIPVSK